MTRRASWLFGGMFWFAGVVSAGAQPLPSGLTTGQTLSFDGETRTFDVYVPPAAADGEPRPLVLDLHGFTSFSSQQRSFSGWLALAEQEGVVVAWPNAIEGAWGVPPFPAIDDVGFLRALTDHLGERFAVDPTQIHVTGFSLGGDMTGTLACAAADRFASFVGIASGTTEGRFEPESCTPVRPVPILNVRGVSDLLVPFEGGMPSEAAAGLGIPPVTFRSSEAQFQFWRGISGCSGAASTQSLGAETSCRTDSSCGASAAVRQCQLRSTATDFFNHILYQNTDGVDLAQLSWDFMQQHPLPPEFLPPFEITEAVDGNWADPDVLLQGLMFDRVVGTDVLFTAWFTYTGDAVAPTVPPIDVGAEGQRWLVASLVVDGSVASGALVAPAGGAFLEPERPDQEVIEVGTLEIEFFGCDRAEVRYALDIGLSGTFPIEPIAKIVAPAGFECAPRAPDVD